MKKKLVSILMATAMVATLFAGCGKSADSAKGGEGSVYWLNFKPEADSALQEIAKTYKEETGVEVKVVTAAEGKYESTLTSEMDKSSAPTPVSYTHLTLPTKA